MVRICDECNYGSYEGRCVICGGMGISDAFYCKVRPLGKSKFSKFLWPFAWLFSLAVASILPLLPCLLLSSISPATRRGHDPATLRGRDGGRVPSSPCRGRVASPRVGWAAVCSGGSGGRRWVGWGDQSCVDGAVTADTAGDGTVRDEAGDGTVRDAAGNGTERDAAGDGSTTVGV